MDPRNNVLDGGRDEKHPFASMRDDKSGDASFCQVLLDTCCEVVVLALEYLSFNICYIELFMAMTAMLIRLLFLEQNMSNGFKPTVCHNFTNAAISCVLS